MKKTHLLPKPHDVPADYVAYNPSAIWTVEGMREDVDIMYVRVEPNQSNSSTSHLGRATVRPYIVNTKDSSQPLRPYYDAQEMTGEDPALVRVKRRLRSGSIENVWLLSCVDARPDPLEKNKVQGLVTRFYTGTKLHNMEHIADGPAWMKDIRIVQSDGPKETELEIFGRPQLRNVEDNGNISHVTIGSLDDLSSDVIESAQIIDEALLPVGSGVWGGVNDVMHIGLNLYVLAAHRAWRTGEDRRGRHYESVLYEFNSSTNRIVEMGVLATIKDFPGGIVKEDVETDLSDVVFTGGGYNGTLDFMTFGIGDGNIGIAKIR